MGRVLSALVALTLAVLLPAGVAARLDPPTGGPDPSTLRRAQGGPEQGRGTAASELSRVMPRNERAALRLPDLDNHLVDPFLAAESSKAIVFLFTSVDCPISNRYAPVVQRLYQTFAAQGDTF